jgi:hypothetical protein
LDFFEWDFDPDIDFEEFFILLDLCYFYLGYRWRLLTSIEITSLEKSTGYLMFYLNEWCYL